ncbi:hypothetical protein GCM10022207_07820 [Streptomyces lannensis]|uniref:Uncharacterized protein n=1 Tax=Streptomyces lannensis TaxID=766498 RepID=A0ABP7JN55_9ACTN
MLAHRLGRAEPGVPRHQIDREIGRLQQLPGVFDALPGQPLAGADADLLAEAACEGAHRHGLLLRHVAQLDGLVEAFERPGAGGGRGGQLRFRQRAVDVLRLAAVAMGRYDRAAGNLVGDGGAVVAAHHVQAQVDAGRDTGRGQDVAVVDEQHIGVDPDPREEPLEVLGFGPVRGGGPAVEATGGREDVDAGADGGEPGARPDVRERRGQLLGEHALLEDGAEFVGRRDDDGVGGGQRLRTVADVDGEVGVGLDRTRWPDGAGDDLVQMPPLGVLGASEDPVRDAQFEGEQSVEGEDDDAVRPERWLTGHGPILANPVPRATRSAGSAVGSCMS